MSFYIPPSFLKNINSSFTNHSTRNKMVNGQLNNAVGMQKGKTLFTKTHQISPQPAIDQVTPAHSEGGKWANTSPGTGYTQKQKLENPKEHSKATKEGLKNLPTMVLAGATSALGGMPTMLGSIAAAAGAYGLGRLAENVTDFYSGAKNEKMAAAKEELQNKK